MSLTWSSQRFQQEVLCGSPRTPDKCPSSFYVSRAAPDPARSFRLAQPHALTMQPFPFPVTSSYPGGAVMERQRPWFQRERWNTISPVHFLFQKLHILLAVLRAIAILPTVVQTCTFHTHSPATSWYYGTSGVFLMQGRAWGRVWLWWRLPATAIDDIGVGPRDSPWTW